MALTPAAAARTGWIDDRYRVVRRLGEGAQGAVFLVEDTARGDRCVLKAVHGLDPAAERALIGEFRYQARLAHPALVAVRELGRARADGALPTGTAYFTADHVDGAPADVAAAAAAGDERPRLVWTIAADVAAALAVVHGAGLVHRDVSPRNVLIAGAGDEARAVLIDLGLSSLRGDRGAARGSPAYMAPEALAGRAEARSDLWSLGALLHELATGAALFARPTVAETARAVLAAPVPAATGVPAALAALIGRLLERAPAGRPASALALLDELDAIGGALDRPVRRRPRPDVLAPAVPAPLVGAGEAVAAVEAALAASAPGVVRVWGPPGASTAEVVAEALRRHQLGALAAGQTPRDAIRGDLDRLAARLGLDPRADASPGAFAAAVARAASGVVIAELGDDPRGDAFVGAAAGGSPGLCVAVLTRAEAPPPRPGVLDVAVGATGVDELAELAAALLGRPVPRAWAESLHRAAGGLPRLAADVLRAAAAAGDALASLPEALAPDAASVAAAFADRVRAGDPARRGVLEVLAIWDGRAPAEAVLATADPAAAGALVAEGVVARDGDELVLSPGLAAAIAARLDAGARAARHAAAAAWAEAAGAEVAVRGRHLAGAAPASEQAPVLVAAAAALLGRGRLAAALALAEAAVDRADDDAVRGEALRLVARAALGLGRYPAAQAAAEEAVRTADARDARLLAARARQRAGDLDGAEAALAALAVGAGGDDEAIGAYARLLVARARYADAARVAGPASAIAAATAGGALRLEAAGLAALYQGDVDGAEAAFAALEAGAAGDASRLGRALALRGLVAQHRGDLVASSALFARAAASSRAAGDVHAAAVADLNAGTALSERGRFAAAVPVLAAASADLAALGAVAERAAAEFNRGNALLGLGQVDAARAAGAAAVERARRHGVPHMEVYGLLLVGDAERRAGATAAAAARYAEAEMLARRAGSPRELRHALIARAELAAAAGEPDPAAAALAEAEALAGDDDRDRVALARGRLLAAGAPTAAARAAGLDALADVGRRARAADRLDVAFRAAAVAAALARPADPERARGLARDAAAIHATLAGEAAPAWTLTLADDPDGRIAAELIRAPAPAAAPPPASSAELGRVRRLLALSRRLNAEGSLDRLLDDVIDAAIEMTSAERGFLLLGAGASLEVVVARGFAAGDLDAAADARLSRSIAERAAQSGEPVITIDAGLDERFGAAASVAALRLRSVMAVPLRQKGRITGCLYIDHRLRGGAFDDDAASLLLELADIAAVAIDNARLTEDLRRQTDQIDALNRRLAADIADRDAELAAVRARLGKGRDALRHAFPAIIGRSPAVVAMLARIERAAEAALPVVIVGESGTGKELVARALHDHGPRRDRPLVAVNCSAMPEALLESELFGHVRGAFTGADRDRRGLFEVADGGTLFLDEVAETGAAMQAKLLRVLQDGTFRRVGDDRTRRADVRIVAASQRPLADLVRDGRFRDDLRFRLEVIAIEVPPLRARDGDVPLLVEHVMARLTAGRTRPRLTRGALRALTAYAWPGNVRELENALARAIALGGDVIDLEDLPDAVVAGGRSLSAARTPSDDLTLKPAVAALERAYVEAAMARAAGNQTVAARLLGLSRFGLQKKLRRLSGDDGGDEGDGE